MKQFGTAADGVALMVTLNDAGNATLFEDGSSVAEFASMRDARDEAYARSRLRIAPAYGVPPENVMPNHIDWRTCP